MSDASWPRTVLPKGSTYPTPPTGQISLGSSNRPQLRATVETGRTWTESYPPLRSSIAAHVAFLAFVGNAWRNQLTFTIDHRSQRTLFGTGAGAPTINGGAQSGSSISTHGWGLTQTVLKAGDVITIAGAANVYDIVADVASNGSGVATITINPPIFSNKSPSGGAAITTNLTPGAVLYRARIASMSPPKANADNWYTDMSITFAELAYV